MPKPNPWPYETTRDLNSFFGAPGSVGNLGSINVMGLGVKYEGKAVNSIYCNKKVGESLLRIIKELSKKHPEVLAEFDGCYNNRNKRGGTTKSLHAYGAAIDFMASRNGNKTAWPSKATMPVAVMEIFAKEGWLSAGAFWGRDAMHFQATK